MPQSSCTTIAGVANTGGTSTISMEQAMRSSAGTTLTVANATTLANDEIRQAMYDTKQTGFFKFDVKQALFNGMGLYDVVGPASQAGYL